jgi:hypothetical protein
MASVELTEQEWGQLMNILATTKEHPWVVTNPFLMKIGEQLRIQHQPNPVASGIRIDANGKEVRDE